MNMWDAGIVGMYVCLLPLNALMKHTPVYACMLRIPVMHHVKLLIPALTSVVYVHGAVFPAVYGVRRVLFVGLRDGDVTIVQTLSKHFDP